MATTAYVWTSWVQDSYTSSSTTSCSYADEYDSTSCAGTTDGFWQNTVQTIYSVRASEESTETGGTVLYDSTVQTEAAQVSPVIVWQAWVADSDGNYHRERESEYADRVAEMDRKAAVAHEERVKREAAKAEAESTAKQLLLDIIGPKELSVYEETGRLFFAGHKHDYIIQKGQLLQVLEKDKVTDICVHLKQDHKYPPTDRVIALLVALMGDEDMVLNIGNWHSPRNRPDVLPRFARAA